MDTEEAVRELEKEDKNVEENSRGMETMRRMVFWNSNEEHVYRKMG